MNRTHARPARHWRRDQLVLRMVGHAARTSTISAWTGVSSNRIRTLAEQHLHTTTTIRHRGQPPRQIGYFFRTLRLATHAATLGSLFELFEVLPDTAVGMPARSFRSVSRGEALCYAYELYCTMVDSTAIRFEHAVLLATALAHGEEISLQGCPQCEARMLVDHYSVATEWCTHCRPSAHLPALPGHPNPTAPDPRFRRPHIQLKLFTPLDALPTPAAPGHALPAAVPSEAPESDVTARASAQKFDGLKRDESEPP